MGTITLDLNDLKCLYQIGHKNRINKVCSICSSVANFNRAVGLGNVVVTACIERMELCDIDMSPRNEMVGGSAKSGERVERVRVARVGHCKIPVASLFGYVCLGCNDANCTFRNSVSLLVSRMCPLKAVADGGRELEESIGTIATLSIG